ncbi:DNA repair ATPase [Streptomyces sp. CAU 1734]|uniref:DNA repair ATPase n=1 Tax=Streptomyces sp. CAU 1734 TaxID=3140360 RepID=UPI003261C18C
MDADAHDVLRDRLHRRAAELGRRAEALNTARAGAFGSGELALAGSGHLGAAVPGLPRGLAAVGGLLLLGRDLPDGLTPGTEPGEIFSLHRPGAGADPEPLPEDAVPGLLDDPSFRTEFASLCRYFQGARLGRLRATETRVLAVFHTGEKDIRVLRWEITPAGAVRFMDARGERDDVLPPPYDVVWTGTTRDDHPAGPRPRVRLDGGTVHAATTGGFLVLTVGEDPESAAEIHREPVEDPLQALADAEMAYARVGPLLLLRVRPYREDTVRHLVVNTLTGSAVRLDRIGQSCRALPDEQGIVFPGGSLLADGTVRVFDTEPVDGLVYERVLRSPGGDEILFAFRSPAGSRTLLLPYSTIRKEIAAPLFCRGYALFPDGALTTLSGSPDGEPARLHPVRSWTSPYVSETHPAPAAAGPLARIGNTDLVRGVSEVLAIVRRAAVTAPTSEVYESLAADCARAADRHHWLGEAAAGDLLTPLLEVRTTAEQALAEYGKVRDLTRRAAEALADTAQDIARLVRRVRGEAPAGAAEWVARITELRGAQGRLAGLRELPYADVAAVDALREDLANDTAATARRAVAFIGRPDGLADRRADAEALAAEAGTLTSTAAAEELTGRIDGRAAGLSALSEVVTGLEIADAGVRTAVLERISEVLGVLNRARAGAAGRRAELAEREGREGFAAESALLAQSVTAALAAADTPESCERGLTAILLQLESLESRFSGHDGFLTAVAERRAEVREAFEARGQSLRDERARRAERLAESAGRVLEAIGRRAAALESADEVHAWFAADPMAVRVRRTAEELRSLGDRVRAEELLGRLKAARQEAGRALRDRRELFEEGGDTIRLGGHRFAVTTRPPELTLVPHGTDGMAFALTGTDYRSPVTDPRFTAARRHWARTLPSESADVCRAEYLAARLLPAAVAGAEPAALIARALADAPEEGYERGVHDHDTAAILRLVLRLRAGAGLLRHPAGARAAAQLFWVHGTGPAERERWRRHAVSLVRARESFGAAPALDALVGELAAAIGGAGFPAVPAGTAAEAAGYLVEELAEGGGSFVSGPAARTLLEKFRRAAPGAESPYEADLRALLAGGDPLSAHRIAEGWLAAWAAARGEETDPGDLAEAVAAELCPELPRREVDAPLTGTVTGLLGSHPRIVRGSLPVRLDEFLSRTAAFAEHEVPGFRAYQELRRSLVAAERERLRPDDHRPRVMSAFVRNRLVDEVYLPLIGDSLAKQLGAAGDARRTDSSGLLLLVSPPGYGKTTLIEYVADRLGLLLVRVDGPALGAHTTSLDPDRAPDAAARRELEKVEFALAAGNNVLLYVDDIQHTSPELLQKFIPLCDATRTLGGRDLRGKRFAVCMAGNPYTESGRRFAVPDMLANRADVWNLGEVLTGREEAFALSFVENALTSHPVLAPLAGRERADLELLTRLAAGDPGARREELAHPYPAAELDRVVAVLGHVLTARKTVLAVNAAYIASAAQADEHRTEPPFRLQGSYRNMNRMVQRISPVMNDAELAAVIGDHYAGEAQTLTTGAEANLLKLAELRGTLDGARAARWAEITSAYVRNRAVGGAAGGGDGDGRTESSAAPGAPEAVADAAVAALGLLAERLAAVEAAIAGRARGPR